MKASASWHGSSPAEPSTCRGRTRSTASWLLPSLRGFPCRPLVIVARLAPSLVVKLMYCPFSLIEGSSASPPATCWISTDDAAVPQVAPPHAGDPAEGAVEGDIAPVARDRRVVRVFGLLASGTPADDALGDERDRPEHVGRRRVPPRSSARRGERIHTRYQRRRPHRTLTQLADDTRVAELVARAHDDPVDPGMGVAVLEALAPAGAVAVAEADDHVVRVDPDVGVADAHADPVAAVRAGDRSHRGSPSTSSVEGAESVDWPSTSVASTCTLWRPAAQPERVEAQAGSSGGSACATAVEHDVVAQRPVGAGRRLPGDRRLRGLDPALGHAEKRARPAAR